jgi:type VI secretion system ImpM family protein
VLFRRSAPSPPPPAPSHPGPLAFGKIPEKGDFVRLGGPSPALDRFDRWAQDALIDARTYRRSLPDAEASPTVRVAFVPEKGPHVLVGACRLSQDRVGRRYPFFVGRAVDRHPLEAQFAPRWPVHWGALFDAATALVEAGVEGRAPLGQLTGRVRALPPAPTALRQRGESLRRYDDALRTLPATALWQATWGDPDASAKSVLFYRLRQATHADAAPGREPKSCGLVFPLPGASEQIEPEHAVAAWTEIAWRTAKRLHHPPSIWWTESEPGRPGRLGIFFGRVPSRAFGLLLGEAARDAPGLCVLDAASADLRPADAALGLPDRLGHLLEAPNLPLGTFLSSL